MILMLEPQKVSDDNVKRSPYVKIAPWEECKDSAHLDKFYQSILDKGGEGVILRDKRAPYSPGRSNGYLKHKVC
jgi:DNA ligase 1